MNVIVKSIGTGTTASAETALIRIERNMTLVGVAYAYRFQPTADAHYCIIQLSKRATQSSVPDVVDDFVLFEATNVMVQSTAVGEFMAGMNGYVPAHERLVGGQTIYLHTEASGGSITGRTMMHFIIEGD